MTGLGDEALEQVNAIIAKLPAEEQAILKNQLQRVITHRRAIARFPTPGHLGQFVRPGFLQTPMMDAIDKLIMSAARGETTKLIINTPPQEGKTTRLQDGAAWLLLRNPTLRIAFASYEQGIAAQSGLAIRQMIETHGGGYRGQGRGEIDRVDALGLSLDPDRSLQTNWTLASVPGAKHKRPGGVLSVGIGSSFTGRPADLLIVDDPLKDAKQADSAVYRKAVKDWFQSVATTRLAPGAIVIVVQTRWHEDDLSGWLLAEDKASTHPEWTHINIPAQAGKDDPLGRQPGEWLTSARGRTPEEWEGKKRALGGGRWWFALYQGDPSPPEGGIFKRVWFDKYRVAEPPELRMVLTVVDPADNDGDGDEAGIWSGGIGADGHIYLLEDNSGHYTIAGWVRQAIFAMLRNKSQRLMYEQSLSGIKRSIRAQWKVLRRQARELIKAQSQWSRFGEDDWPTEPNPRAVSDAHLALMDEDDSKEDISILEKQLLELWPYAPRLMKMPEAGPPVRSITARGSKSLRAELISPVFENGEAHFVGFHPTTEHQMSTWLPTQDSPDRMDAVVHLTTELSQTGGQTSVQGAKGTLPKRQRDMPQILRSTRSGAR
jgi:hypothetical protein